MGKNKINIIAILAIVFIVANGIVYYIAELNKEQKIEPVLENHIKNLQTHFQALLYHQKTIADLMYESTIQIPEVIEILTKTELSSTDEEKAILRKQLQDRLEIKYERMQTKGVLQYHFVTPKNITFLRMHKPSKFGDDLSDIRYSVKYVNETKKIFRGFDQGKTSHAFRNIYPIFDKNGNYLGSVDISFPSEVLQSYLTDIGNMHTHLLINKNIFSVKSWQREDFALKYSQSPEHDDYMFIMENRHAKQKHNVEKKFKLKKIQKQINVNIKKGKEFSNYYKENDKIKILTFYPVRELKNDTVVSWVVAYEDDYLIATALEFNLLIKIASSLALLLLGYFIYNVLTQKDILNIQVSKELEKNREKDQQLIQQSRLAQMGEMISMIAHQWRQPLTAISSAANALTIDVVMDNYKKEFFQEQIDNISSYAQHLSSTIDDFRNFFKNDKEKYETTLEEIVENTLSIINTSLENKNISLTTEFNCNEKINTYPNELKQVVLNLIKNAEDVLIEKEIENPKIEIKTYKKDDNYYLTVEDNAGGIPKEIIDKIFDPYFSTKKEKDGTGLGLYMSKTIVEEHCDGKLSVENGKNGAVFIVELYIQGEKV